METTRDLDRVFEAFANKHRREIVYVLGLQPHSISQLAEMRGLSLPAIHKHIKVLERAGLVARRIDGREHWLTINWTRLQPAYEWLHFYRHFWNARLDALADYVQLKPEKKGKDQ